MSQDQNNTQEKKDIANKDYPNPEYVSYIDPQGTDHPQQIIASIMRTDVLSGPLPHPDLLKGYGDIIPNGAERIMQMAEREQDSVLTERRETRNNNREISIYKLNLLKRGQNMGFSLAILIIALATLFVFTGHEGIAYLLFSVGIASIVGVFVKTAIDSKKK